MALIVPGGIAPAISGAVGGNVFAHNRGGYYVRNRVVPTNPNSALQQERRLTLGGLATQWKEISDADRTSWDNYAANTPVTNRVGATIHLTGQQMFIRVNSLVLLAELARKDAGPETPGLSDLGNFGWSLSSNGYGYIYNIEYAGWTGEGGVLLVFGSAPVSPTINFFKGPFQYKGQFAGDSPAFSGGSLAITNPAAPGQRQFFRFIALDAEGRPSNVEIISEDPEA